MQNDVTLSVQWPQFCAVAPSPELRERIRNVAAEASGDSRLPLSSAGSPQYFGFNDGVICRRTGFRPELPRMRCAVRLRNAHR